MKLAFAHHRDVLRDAAARHPGAAGIHSAAANIALHLEKTAAGFHYMAPLRNLCTPWTAAQILFRSRGRRRGYYGWAEPSLSRGYGRQIARRLNGRPAQAVLCTEVKHAAFLKTDRPVVLWTDSMYSGLFDYYETFSGLDRRTVRNLQMMDRAAVKHCARLIFASDWAAQRAKEFCGATDEQVKVVPYGANLTSGMDRTDAERRVGEKTFEGPCRLLFAGVEWRRKGGDTAIRIAERLQSRGMPVELTVLGTDPAKHLDSIPSFVKSAGFLSPANPDELEQMKQLYRDAHLLLLPCRAECFGHIFPEANCFALPVVASNTGGIPTAVHQNVNGFCFDPEDAEAFADCIQRLFTRPDEYRALALRAFDDYTARLSWPAAARQVTAILEAL